MRVYRTATSLILTALTFFPAVAGATEDPTSGQLEMKIVTDSDASGKVPHGSAAFKTRTHQEIVINAKLVFTHTDANDSVAEGYKDASKSLHAKTKPMADAADKVGSSDLMKGGLMQAMEQCSELEDEDAMQACMMKAASGLQGQMQDKCTKDPSLCAAVNKLTDQKNLNDVEAGARELEKAMKQFRFYAAESCTVDASIDYWRQDQSPDLGSLSQTDRTSKTNGLVRGAPGRSAKPCSVEVAVGPDNTMSLKFSLSDTLTFPATHTNPNHGTEPDRMKLETGGALKLPYLVKKQKSASPVAFTGAQGFANPAKTSQDSGWVSTGSSSAKVSWNLKLN